jgi:branched-chain amino acid transport system substrate-binding protein
MLRRTLLKITAGILGAPMIGTRAHAEEMLGVTANEIKIGQTMIYSGPGSSYGVIGRLDGAYFRMMNERGGIAGRKINFISLDDGYTPPRTVEQTRRLVEQDGVAFLFNSTGTPTNTAVHKYLNSRGVPQLFVATGADKWGDYKHYHWTMGWQPSYRTEAQIYAKYVLARRPSAKIGILYQNDDFGKDYVLGLRDVLGDKFDRMVKPLTYEITDPTIDSQIVSLQSSGADTLILAAIAKFVAQGIRQVYEIGWKPLFFVSNVSTSVGTVMRPAGVEKGIGVISTYYLKDPTDPAWNNDPGMMEWRAFMAKYLPNADLADASNVYAYGVSKTLEQVLHQCGGDFSRANIMRQAANLHDLEIPVLLPGIRINTSPANYHPIRQMQLARWNGKTWKLFGDVIEGSGA